jgi:hypothetical protein
VYDEDVVRVRGGGRRNERESVFGVRAGDLGHGRRGGVNDLRACTLERDTDGSSIVRRLDVEGAGVVGAAGDFDAPVACVREGDRTGCTRCDGHLQAVGERRRDWSRCDDREANPIYDLPGSQSTQVKACQLHSTHHVTVENIRCACSCRHSLERPILKELCV